MRVESLQTLHADAGWRRFDYLKLVADNGLVGWSEYSESYGGRGITAVIESLRAGVVGSDPRRVGATVMRLRAARGTAPSGLAAQAIGAIENALWDLKARALGVPVHELFGGAQRSAIPLYWSHLGTWRVGMAQAMRIPPLHTLDELAAHTAEVVAQGFRSVKTNVLLFDEQGARGHAPCFGRGSGFPELNAGPALTAALHRQLAAMREAAGPQVEILVDLNMNYRLPGAIEMARTMQPHGVAWVEVDGLDPPALRQLRERAGVPVASCEILSGRREVRPYLDAAALDVVIVDVPWNGIAESLAIASLADSYAIPVAPHNFYSPLATMMSAHFAAVVPNLRVMEIDGDVVPWQDSLVTVKPRIEGGQLHLPEGPGWGTEIDEVALRAWPVPPERAST